MAKLFEVANELISSSQFTFTSIRQFTFIQSMDEARERARKRMEAANKEQGVERQP